MVVVEKARNRQLKKINKLIDKYFGAGFSSTKTIISNHHFAFVALEESNVIGVVLGKVVSARELQKLNKNTVDTAEKFVGILDLIAVHKNYRNEGIGKALFEVRLKEFEKRGIREMYLFHWVREEQPKAFIAEKFGFRAVQKIDNYWLEESLTEGYECGECGGDGCKCGCLVYVHRSPSAVAEA